MKTPIWIPTYGREKVITLSQLSTSDRLRTRLVVESDEVGKKLTEGTNASYQVCPVQGKGVHIVRDWIVQQCIKMDIDNVIMLDDDLRFHQCTGFKDSRKQFTKASPLQVEYALFECEKILQHPNVGFASFSQGFHNNSEERWAEYKDNASTYFHRAKLTTAFGITYGIPSVDDRHFILSVIEKGFKVNSYTYLTATKVGKHGKGGEAATGNRGKKHEESLHLLADRYPRFVKLYATKSQSYIENYGTSLAAKFYYVNMAKYVAKGGNARDPLKENK